MIGPGTGVAPFRSFILDRSIRDLGENLLFFGCRHKDKDFYFETEWEVLEKNCFLILKTAFSRDQERKVYVQQKIAENASLVWKWLSDSQAWVFVAGNSNQMPKDVIKALEDVAKGRGGMGHTEAENFMIELEKSGRLQMETWS